MPTCPKCRTEQTKRVRGACPKCGAKIDVYMGRWIEAGPKSPAATILTHFEDRVSGALSKASSTPVTFSIPRKGLSYRRELHAAGRLFEIADYNMKVTLRSVDKLFNHPKLNFKTRSSLLYVEKDFLIALALVKAEIAAETVKESIEQKVIQDVLSRPSLFS
jgi:hypothetical protein